MRYLTLLIAVVVLCLSSGAVAQIVVESGDEGVRMDNINTLETNRPILEYVLAGGFLIGSLALGFMSSKRTHLD